MKKFIFILPILILMLIFYFSEQGPKQSTNQSRSFLNFIENSRLTNNPTVKQSTRFIISKTFLNNYKTKEAILRKIAHLTLYMVLSILFCFSIYIKIKKIKYSLILGIIIPTIFAFSDELHQTFVGRSGSLKDVLVDFKGVFLGSIIFYIMFLIYKKIKTIKLG